MRHGTEKKRRKGRGFEKENGRFSRRISGDGEVGGMVGGTGKGVTRDSHKRGTSETNSLVIFFMSDVRTNYYAKYRGE